MLTLALVYTIQEQVLNIYFFSIINSLESPQPLIHLFLAIDLLLHHQNTKIPGGIIGIEELDYHLIDLLLAFPLPIQIKHVFSHHVIARHNTGLVDLLLGLRELGEEGFSLVVGVCLGVGVELGAYFYVRHVLVVRGDALHLLHEFL